jgi:type II secretory pathway component PulM
MLQRTLPAGFIAPCLPTKTTKLRVRVMSRAQLRELVMLFAIGSALTLAVFFLTLWLLPFERLPPFSFPRFPGFP